MDRGGEIDRQSTDGGIERKRVNDGEIEMHERENWCR